MKWYQDSEGNTSSMRMMAMIATVTGALAVLGGVLGMFLGRPDAAAIAAVGAGMGGVGEVAKAWQAQKGR